MVGGLEGLFGGVRRALLFTTLLSHFRSCFLGGTRKVCCIFLDVCFDCFAFDEASFTLVLCRFPPGWRVFATISFRDEGVLLVLLSCERALIDPLLLLHTHISPEVGAGVGGLIYNAILGYLDIVIGSSELNIKFAKIQQCAKIFVRCVAYPRTISMYRIHVPCTAPSRPILRFCWPNEERFPGAS